MARERRISNFFRKKYPEFFIFHKTILSLQSILHPIPHDCMRRERKSGSLNS